MASIPGSQFVATAPGQTVNVIETSDGSVPPPIAGQFNLEVWTGAGSPPGLAPGYQGLAILSAGGQQIELVTGVFAVQDVGSGNDTLIASGDNETIIGGSGNETMIANGAFDVIVGGGQDTINVYGHDDTVNAVGNNSISVIGDNNTVNAGSGNDTINILGDNDIVQRRSNDTINLYGDNDFIDLGAPGSTS